MAEIPGRGQGKIIKKWTGFTGLTGSNLRRLKQRMNQLLDKDITEKIIGCAFTVHRALGFGFLEKVYENAMVHELRKSGLFVLQQAPIAVHYDNQRIGEYFADLLVENKIICELKANISFAPEHEIQLVNYLVATGLDVGLLFNFGKSVTVKRKSREYVNPNVNSLLSTGSNQSC